MEKFVEVPTRYHWEYKAGPITVIAARYLLGQYRLQVLYDDGNYLPSVLPPEC